MTLRARASPEGTITSSKKVAFPSTLICCTPHVPLCEMSGPENVPSPAFESETWTFPVWSLNSCSVYFRCSSFVLTTTNVALRNATIRLMFNVSDSISFTNLV